MMANDVHCVRFISLSQQQDYAKTEAKYSVWDISVINSVETLLWLLNTATDRIIIIFSILLQNVDCVYCCVENENSKSVYQYSVSEPFSVFSLTNLIIAATNVSANNQPQYPSTISLSQQIEKTFEMIH